MRHAKRSGPRAWALGLALLACHCGVSEAPSPLGTARAPILQGSLVDAQDAAVLFLKGNRGSCSATLVAPNLVVTARHCVAASLIGAFSCSASGELIPTGDGHGALGKDDPAGDILFFTAEQMLEGVPANRTTASAVGKSILSTGSSTACRDDLAFVVLSNPLALTPMPMRIDDSMVTGESLSIWGYGLTEQRADPPKLRARKDAALLGVGPSVPAETTQPAPVRAIRTSPVTCPGDSGGPIASVTTGAIVAVVSLGTLSAGTLGPFCSNNELNETVGPRLAAYPTLIATALEAAQAAMPSRDADTDAATGQDSAALDTNGLEDPDANSSLDAAPSTDGTVADVQASSDDEDGAAADTSTAGRAAPEYAVRGGGCAVRRGDARSSWPRVTLAALALLAWIGTQRRAGRRHRASR